MLPWEFFLLRKAELSYLSVSKAQEQYIHWSSSWAQNGIEEGTEVWTYGRPVIPGPASPKTVTVCLCLSCWGGGICWWQSNGGF